jgi:CRP/FNR family transcriptional regulator, cyclic AMP receptor protein
MKGMILYPHYLKLNLTFKIMAKEEVRVNAGDVIVEQGGKSDGFFVLKQGSVGVYVDDVLIDVFMAKNAIVGEMSLILDRPRTATVKARGACTIIKYNKTIKEIIKEEPEVAEMMMFSLAGRLDHANQKILEMTKEKKVWED